ncbi:MAG: C40 family peptidase [Anaerococcus sp.]
MEKIKKQNSYYLILIFSFIITLFSSCGSKRKMAKEISKEEKIVNYAKNYLGTPYQYGGTTPRGMDCSGLIQTSYYQYGIKMPRTTKGLLKAGKRKPLRKAKVGDLVFFRTSKRSRKKNHVGIVTKVNGDAVDFIHSSTSSGVIISSTENPYWNKAFAELRRYIK